MKKDEAEQIIGKIIKTPLFKGGYYFGELISLTEDKPFRAIIRVMGVVEHPKFYFHNTQGGFVSYKVNTVKENTLIEVGNGIEVYNEEILTYEDSLINSLYQYLDKVSKHLEEYIKNDGHFHSYYIFNQESNIKLIEIIKDRIEKIQSGNRDLFYFSEEELNKSGKSFKK